MRGPQRRPGTYSASSSASGALCIRQPRPSSGPPAQHWIHRQVVGAPGGRWGLLGAWIWPQRQLMTGEWRKQGTGGVSRLSPGNLLAGPTLVPERSKGSEGTWLAAHGQYLGLSEQMRLPVPGRALCRKWVVARELMNHLGKALVQHWGRKLTGSRGRKGARSLAHRKPGVPLVVCTRIRGVYHAVYRRVSALLEGQVKGRAEQGVGGREGQARAREGPRRSSGRAPLTPST